MAQLSSPGTGLEEWSAHYHLELRTGQTHLVDLVGIPGPGNYERLVAAVPTIRLPAPADVVRAGNVVIRLRAESNLMRSDVQVIHEIDGSTWNAMTSERTVTGPFIEIVSPDTIG